MYWRDHNPPHFHAVYGEDEALVKIADGTVLAGSLPRTAARLVGEWTRLRRKELMANWERAQAPADWSGSSIWDRCSKGASWTL